MLTTAEIRNAFATNRYTLPAIAAVAAVAITVPVYSRVHDGYDQFVAEKTAELQSAQSANSLAIENFKEQTDRVGVTLMNETGGTMRVYVGTIGSTQIAGAGVDVSARPNLIDSLAPHSTDTIYVHDWETKYVVSQTQYMFWPAVNAPVGKLAETTYSQPLQGPAFTYYRAEPSSGDQNYAGMPDPMTRPQAASDVMTSQAHDIARYENTHHVDVSQYASDFGSYLKSVV